MLLAFAFSLLQGIEKESSFSCDYSLSLRGCALELQILAISFVVEVLISTKNCFTVSETLLKGA